MKQKKILLAISAAAFVAGMGIGAWGLIKVDCNGGPGCWVGSGFLMWTGGIMIVGGLLGMWRLGGKTKR